MRNRLTLSVGRRAEWCGLLGVGLGIAALIAGWAILETNQRSDEGPLIGYYVVLPACLGTISSVTTLVRRPKRPDSYVVEAALVGGVAMLTYFLLEPIVFPNDLQGSGSMTVRLSVTVFGVGLSTGCAAIVAQMIGYLKPPVGSSSMSRHR